MWTRNLLTSTFLVTVATLSAPASTTVSAFSGVSCRALSTPTHDFSPSSVLRAEASAGAEGDEETVEQFLKSNYPLFENLIFSTVPNIYGSLALSDESKGYTLFVASDSVMEQIDSQRKLQLSDPRNLEVLEKLAGYHVVPNGKVTQERLKREDWTVPRSPDGVVALAIGGVLTLSGELRVGRSKSGGFMGWYAKEDGGVVIGNNDAKIIKSTLVGAKGVVHEVDGLVAPDLIWRYFDQLRIPGF